MPKDKYKKMKGSKGSGNPNAAPALDNDELKKIAVDYKTEDRKKHLDSSK